jgi:HK97 gp10 family phage protein
MGVTVRWLGDRVLQDLDRTLDQALQRAASLLLTQARLACNRPAKRIRRKRRRTTSAGPKGSQYTVFIGSAPGQAPMVRTSFGRRNILMEYYPETKTARVGPATNAAYMAYLELGTDRIEPRPWLRPTLDRCRGAVENLLRSALQRHGQSE